MSAQDRPKWALLFIKDDDQFGEGLIRSMGRWMIAAALLGAFIMVLVIRALHAYTC